MPVRSYHSLSPFRGENHTPVFRTFSFRLWDELHFTGSEEAIEPRGEWLPGQAAQRLEALGK